MLKQEAKSEAGTTGPAVRSSASGDRNVQLKAALRGGTFEQQSSLLAPVQMFKPDALRNAGNAVGAAASGMVAGGQDMVHQGGEALAGMFRPEQGGGQQGGGQQGGGQVSGSAPAQDHAAPEAGQTESAPSGQIYDEAHPRPISQASPQSRRAIAEAQYQHNMGRVRYAMAHLDPATRGQAMARLEELHSALLAAAERGQPYTDAYGARSGGVLQALSRGNQFYTNSGERGVVIEGGIQFNNDGSPSVTIAAVGMEEHTLVILLGRYNFQSQQRETAADTRVEGGTPGSLGALAGRAPAAQR